ncbi:MAG: carboxypeptidase regulatory-like domain-containing protein [Herpetosiphonaceae bacterium]|nr:carboxypeptidase regulatory-like domain-containing protein [Herpetosiphonaceae bacterium]
MFIRPWKYYLSVAVVALLTSCGTPVATGGDSTPSSSTLGTSSTTATDPASNTTTPSTTVSDQPSSAPAQGGSGIEGRTVIGPVCPVARANQPCPPQPYPAKINVMGTGSQPITQAQSDTQGQFRIDLPAGTYTLMPLSPGIYPRAAPQTVTVGASGYISVTIAYDSGIR